MKPVLQSLLLADYVYQDVSGKKVIAGVSNKLFFRKVQPQMTPTEMAQLTVGATGSPCAYISLTEIRGVAKFELRCVDLQFSEALLGVEFELKCDDPLQTVEVIVPVPRLPHPHEGVYAFELFCDKEMIGSLRIVAEELRNGGPEIAEE